MTDEQVKQLVIVYEVNRAVSDVETSIIAVKWYSKQQYHKPLTTEEVRAIISTGNYHPRQDFGDCPKASSGMQSCLTKH